LKGIKGKKNEKKHEEAQKDGKKRGHSNGDYGEKGVTRLFSTGRKCARGRTAEKQKGKSSWPKGVRRKRRNIYRWCPGGEKKFEGRFRTMATQRLEGNKGSRKSRRETSRKIVQHGERRGSEYVLNGRSDEGRNIRQRKTGKESIRGRVIFVGTEGTLERRHKRLGQKLPTLPGLVQKPTKTQYLARRHQIETGGKPARSCSSNQKIKQSVRRPVSSTNKNGGK